MVTRFSLAALVATFTLPALADTRIEYADEKSGAPQTVILIKDGKVRFNNADTTAWTLYDRKANTLTSVDPEQKSYTVMDRESMQQLSGEMSAAMAEMRKQLEQMPPEQRAMMEKMMGGAGDLGKNAMEMKVERTGRTLEKAGYDCEQVFFSVGAFGRSELCVVDADEIDIPKQDRETLDAMQEHMKSLAETMSKGTGMNFTFDFDSLGGMAVYMKSPGDSSGDVLKTVSSSKLAASEFQVPNGYREEKMEIAQ